MFYFLSLLTGIIISVMLAFNGMLTEQYGLYSATVIIHIVGLLFIIIMAVLRRDKLFPKRQAWYLYLGGAIGVMTTVFNNFAFSRISVSSILALGLFGQSITGIIIDQYGILGMPKYTFRKSKIIGLILILCGIVYMTDNFDVLAVLFSFIAGINIVVSRTFNAKLAEQTSVSTGTFYNYLVGLLIAVPVCFILGRSEAAFAGFAFSPRIYIYLGGMVGVCVVILSNITVTKVSAFYLSLFLFIGQVFSGILVDVILSQSFSVRNMAGGFLVALGLCINLLLDRKMPRA